MAPHAPKPPSSPAPPEGAPREEHLHSVPSPAPENLEHHWARHVFRPDERQLTVRAVLAGMVIGVAMCASNLYVVLKTGWSLGVTLTSCILAYGVFRLLRVLRLSRHEFTELENNAMGSVASAAGYMTGGGNMAALPALILLTGIRPDGWGLVLWFASISALGVFAAIPIKRQLINLEQLPFPTGTATAQTIQALHGHSGEGARKGKLLGLAALAGGVLVWVREARGAWMPFNLPDRFGLPFSLGGTSASSYTLAFDNSLLLAGTGALMSFRVGWSLLVGALLMWGVVGPKLVAEGIIAQAGYRPILTWAIWPGAAMLVGSGLLSFAFQWKSVARSFSGLAGALTGRKEDASADPLADIECPPAWFPLGFALLGPLVVVLAWWLFDIPPWAGLVSLPLAFAMGMVAARVTGETDTTPTKALGPLTQLVYGGLLPGQLVPNIMSANITGGVGLHAADLLTDLKSGYLLGARPRQQVYAQLFGCVAGALAIVPMFNLIVPDVSVLGGQELPAPAAQVWAGVSKVMATGLSSVPESARWAALWAGLAGVLLTLGEKFAPARLKPFLPSPTGLGIAAIMPAYNAISMFLGAAVAEWVRRRRPSQYEGAVIPLASGGIAGESLVGLVIIMLKNFAGMPK
jgi:uncharacterized oligopeptide transporter (OPT) family protein